jgi:hypothetical protein
MKTPVLLLALSLWAQHPFAQAPEAQEAKDPAKVREIGLFAFGLTNYGFTYRWGHERAVWRFQTARLKLGLGEQFGNASPSGSRSANLKLGIAREWRKPLADRIDLRLGCGLAIGLEHRWGDGGDQINRGYGIEPAANFIFGLNYRIKERFLVGAEIDPQLGYAYARNTTTTQNDTQIVSSQGITLNSSNQVALSFCLRF